MAEFAVTAFLALSLTAYVIAGGADFGVGILELFAPKEQRPALRRAGEHAIAPVWEANHIWIIVALVILFVAFPSVHVQLTTSLHIPLALMLVGIVLRGTAFTFRYYDLDSEADGGSDKLWTLLFRGGSLLVPLMFGHLAAALSRGRLFPANTSTESFAGLYLAPWLGLFPLACGLFTVFLFGWLAAVFLVGEQQAHPGLRAPYIAKANRWTLLLVAAGGFVTLAAFIEGVPWLAELPARPLALSMSLAFGALASLALFMVRRSLHRASPWPTRAWASIATTAVLAGYFGSVYPVAVQLRDGPPLTWPQAIAGEPTVQALAGALMVGSLLILPGLAFLYRLFKTPASVA